MKRAVRFLGKVLLTILFFALIGGIFFILQTFFHLFDGIISYVNQDISKVNSSLSQEALAGISFGAIALVVFILLFPLLMKGIKRKQYWISIQRGIISSLVFFLSQAGYQYAERFSRFYLFLSIAAVIVITLIFIEVLALSIRKEKESEFRTDIIAAVVSGLVFGILIKLILVAISSFHFTFFLFSLS